MQAGTFFPQHIYTALTGLHQGLIARTGRVVMSTYAYMHTCTHSCIHTHVRVHTGTSSMERTLGLYIHS